VSTLPVGPFSTDAVSVLAASSELTLGRSAMSSVHATTDASVSVDTPRQHKLRQAAQQFESMLMSSLWKSMKSSFDDDSDSDPALGTLQDWSMDAMSNAVGKVGGLGIARLIMKDLEPRISPSQSGKEVPKS